MKESIPIYLLTGSLGSGKTTLMNHLLSFSRFTDVNACLIINEFGELGVDGELVDAGERPVFELNKGSIFCVCVKTDFIETLRVIATEVRPDCLLIEATGMAEPRDVQDFIDLPELTSSFHVEANLCVVDALDFIRIVPMLKSVRQQVAWADLLLINKCDMVTEDELSILEDVLAEMNPHARSLRIERGMMPEDAMEGLTHRTLRGDVLVEPPDPVFAESFQATTPVDRDALESALRGIGDHLLRLKGQVDFGDGSEFFEYAGGILRASADKSIRSIAKTPTAFIAIGWRMKQTEFRDAIESALSID